MPGPTEVGVGYGLEIPYFMDPSYTVTDLDSFYRCRVHFASKIFGGRGLSVI